MNFTNKNILVFGGGISGIAAAKLLIKEKAFITLYDASTDYKIKDNVLSNYENLILITKELKEEHLLNIDLVIISPGVPLDIDEIKLIKKMNIKIWGEIELGYFFSRGKIIGITGTNGKTTTTALVGEIMKLYYKDVKVAGNIGSPYTAIVDSTSKTSISVIELSSFQLETIINFRPDISAILNISEDHLNRHHTIDEYIRAKLNIIKNQKEDDYCIINYDDIEIKKHIALIRSKIIYFSKNSELENGIYLKNNEIIYSHNGIKDKVCKTNELKLLGLHNYENVMAAIGISIALNLPLHIIRKAIIDFKAVEHRIEYVRTFKGVKYYNDSKGTNVDASIKAIEAMDSETILIAGGYDKDSDFKALIKSFNKTIKMLILIGETKDKIERIANMEGYKNIIKVNTLKESVTVAMASSKQGDNVLLSPACASWDMFKDYEERGNLFKQYVNELE